MAAPKSPRTVLGADILFSKGVKVGVGSSTRAMVKAILEADMLDSGLELFCRGLVLTRLSVDAYVRRVEEVTRLQ